MITEQEAQDLMIAFIDLRDKCKSTKDISIINEFKKHEKKCIEQFSYIVTMRTSRYKAFSNYNDLNQEGLEALVKAMKTYVPTKGSWFWWAHKYVDTRISRSANLHTTIRYPLKVAKNLPPHKETLMPLLIEEQYCPDKELESEETVLAIDEATAFLTEDQKNVLYLSYGLDGDKPMSVNKICKKLNITRPQCMKLMKTALATMKDHIKI